MKLFTLAFIAITHLVLLTGCADTTSNPTVSPEHSNAQAKAAANQSKVEAATRY